MGSLVDSFFSVDREGAADSLFVMLDKECKAYAIRGYLDECRNKSDSDDSETITVQDRTEMVDWCYAVVDSCKFQRETVTIAMDLADHFLSIESSRRRDYLEQKKYQLIVISSLYTAIKLNEQKVIDSNMFSSMCQEVHTAREIEEMEISILMGVGWKICAPTPLEMSHLILALVFPKVNISERTWEHILCEVQFQVECAVRDYYFVTERSSTIAVAAILNALEKIENHVDRTCLCRALLSVMTDFNFASISVFFATKKRLSSQIEGCIDIAPNMIGSYSSRSEITTGFRRKYFPRSIIFGC